MLLILRLIREGVNPTLFKNVNEFKSSIYFFVVLNQSEEWIVVFVARWKKQLYKIYYNLSGLQRIEVR